MLFTSSMGSIRQKQVAETIRRHFSQVLLEEGSYIYGSAVLVTVTQVKLTADFGQAKIYLSVFNTENKQEVLLELEDNYPRLKHSLSRRLRHHVRRMPELAFYLDDTLDEMYRLNALFNDLESDNQMGNEEE